MDQENTPEKVPQQPNPTEPTEVTTDTSDEQVPVDVSGEVITPGSAPKRASDFKPPRKSINFKKFFLWLLVIIILLGLGAAAYWFYQKQSSDNSNGSNTNNSKRANQEPANTLEPENVSYAYRLKDSDPYVIYYRPAIGGKRITVSTLGSTDFVTYSDTVGQNVVYVVDNKIYVSTDGGAKFNTIFTGTAGSQITSVKFSSEGDNLAFGYLEEAGGKNVVKSVDLEGKNPSDLFTSDKVGADYIDGVFLLGWSNDKQKIVYRQGCYACDGPPSLPILRDLKSNKASNITLSSQTINIANIDVSDDLSTLIYVKADHTLGVGSFGAPFTVVSVNMSTSKETTIATAGTKGEKNPNGTDKTRITNVGFLIGTNTAYYSIDNQLFTVKDNKGSLAYESTKDIIYVLYISDKTIIVGSGKDTSDYALDNYDIAAKKATNIFSGDNNTIIFGVTTK